MGSVETVGSVGTLVKIFGELDIEQVSYKQWEPTDRTELVTYDGHCQQFC